MAKKDAGRLSYCLRHQERVTDVRCAACLKPICEDCVFSTDLGKFCGNECYEKRQKSDERVERIRLEDEAQRGPRLMRQITSWLFTFLIIFGIYISYPKWPIAIRGPINKMVHKVIYPNSHH